MAGDTACKNCCYLDHAFFVFGVPPRSATDDICPPTGRGGSRWTGGLLVRGEKSPRNGQISENVSSDRGAVSRRGEKNVFVRNGGTIF